MGKAEDLIKSVMQNSKLNGDKTYRDEPIIFTAAKMKSYTPKKYTEMKQLISERDKMFMPANAIFYKQAEFMADFTDDFDFTGNFFAYRPSYLDMPNQQLRGYFSWRTRYKNGEKQKTPTPFLLLYIYELLNLVGASSPEDAFLKLKGLSEDYKETNPTAELSLRQWIYDFAAYYNIDTSYLKDFKLDEKNTALDCLISYKEKTAKELFNSLCIFSSYRLESSSFYKSHPEAVEDAAQRLFIILTDYYENANGGDIFIRLFGTPSTELRTMFASTLFYEKKPHIDCEYKINNTLKYVCLKNNWYTERFFPVKDKAGKLGVLLKSLDFYLRKRYGVKTSLKKPEISDILENAVKRAVNEHFSQKLEREKPIIAIDVSKLQSIRDISEITKEKLIVEEEPEIAATEEVKPEMPPTKEDYGIPYANILLSIIRGENSDAAARKEGVMLSIAVDSINEALFDTFGDTVIEFSGSSPYIIEDYSEDLKGMLNI